MTHESVPQADTPQELLATVRDLTRQVRVAQRGTWFPLLVFAVVTLVAIPVYRYAPYVDLFDTCRSSADHTVCRTPNPTELGYWTVALMLAYAAIAGFYIRQARQRGVGTPVRPYVVAGIALAVLMAAASVWWTFHPLVPLPADPFSTDPIDSGTAELLILGLTSPLAVIGLALLVLAWVERHGALLVYSLAYLAIGLAMGGKAIQSTSPWFFLPYLLVPAGILLLGAAAFALLRPSTKGPA
ncbi:hypothetical protein F4553_001873 [Allocatelliglobosispora scoriae]|uniref:Uncharacterized protein n=1 Tax=Allocatelliglobosispora scoriae TaxID=643052 RepID=A0A841BJQ6_9ACTN|nr:hypothetical protein [Allocatelliglobosispora scoriae]MBB5868494.1 hypothetical protein [Allocatelliglobosispora scoriae]